MEAERKTKAIEKYLAGDSDDVQIQVNNIVLDGPAEVTVSSRRWTSRRCSATRDGSELRREKYIESITFSFTSEVPNALIPVNPLGLMVTYLREDQAF